MDMAQASKPENTFIKDRIVQDLPDKLGLTREMPPTEKFAKILGVGAPIKNVVNHIYQDGELVPSIAPAQLKDGRDYILLGGNAATPRMGIEATRFAVSNALPITEHRATSDDSTQFMLPYPHCEEPEKIVGGTEESKAAGVASIDLLMISQKQLNALKEILKQRDMKAAAGASVSSDGSVGK